MKKYARLNIRLEGGPNEEADAAEWLKYLHLCALDGHADDFEIFYTQSRHIVGVSVPYSEDEHMELLDAGAVLGYCLARHELAGLPHARQTWLSIHDADDQTLYSPL
jgi:hypothetical protein